MSRSQVIEKLRLAADEFVGKIVDNSHHYQPRGGSPFPNEVIGVLGYDCAVTPECMLGLSESH